MADFLSLCRVEHERVWIERMFASITDHAKYNVLIAEYELEGSVLEARRRLVRSALMHGNPVSFTVVQSVRSFAEFLGSTALNFALESFVDRTDPATTLTLRTDEFVAMQSGLDAVSYWRGRITKDGWPLPK